MRVPPTFGQVARELEGRGFEPIPITRPRPGDPTAGKRPAVADWQRGGSVRLWLPRYSGCGTGLLTRRTPAVDIDVRHAECAQALEALAFERLGPAPTRIGAAPKRLLLYRARVPFAKLRSRAFVLPGDDLQGPGYKPHAVEILGDGEQCVAYGIHPGTGRAYVWPDDSPLDLELHDLREIDEAAARDLLDAAEALLLRCGAWPHERHGQIRQGGAPRTQRRTSPLGLAAELRRVRGALAAIPNPDLHHDDWLAVGIALKGAVGEEGRALFHAFSARSPKYDPRFTDRAWDSLRQVREKGAGSIFHLAREHGWRDPAPSPAGTSLPPYHDGPDLPREEALARQRQAIEGWLDTAARRTLALAEAARRRDEAHAAVDRELGLGEAGLAGGEEAARAHREARRRKAAASQRINAEAARRHGFDRLPRQGTRLLLTGSQGTGKTAAALEVMARETRAVLHAYLAPTRAKAEEAARDYHAAGGRRPALVIRGRSAVDPALDDDGRMCPRHTVVERAAAMGVEVRKEICARCPLAGGCGYLRQERRIAAIREGKAGGVFFAASAYVFLPAPFGQVDAVVVDESVLDQAVEVVHFRPERLLEDARWAGGSVGEACERRRIAVAIHKALTAHPGRELDALREAGVGRDGIVRLTTHLYALGELLPRVDGAMSDAQIAAALDAIERTEAGKLLRTLGAIRRELEQPRARLNAVTHEADRMVRIDGAAERQPRVVACLLRRPGSWLTANTPVLLLDGTGSLRLNQALFGSRLREERCKVERLGRVVQTRGKGFSKASLLGTDSQGRPLSAPGLQEAQELRREIAALAGRVEGPTFVAAAKPVVAALRDDRAAGDCRLGHFGALRGVNAFADCRTAIVVGREQSGVRQLEELARAFAAGRAEPFLSAPDPDDPECRGLVPCCRRRRTRDGRVSITEVEVHPDPLAQELLEQIREAGVVQAVDRVRPIFQARELYLLNRLVVDVTVDAEMTWSELRRGRRQGTRLAEAWARTPVRLLSAAELARVFPDLWPSAEAANKDLQRSGEKKDTSQMESYLGDVLFLEARYWRSKGQTKPYRALLPAGCPAPRQALETLVGPVRRLELAPPPSSAPVVRFPAASQHDLFADAPPSVPLPVLDAWRQGPIPPSVRAALRHEIARRGLRQREAARRIGISRPQLTKALSGRFGLSAAATAGARLFLLEGVEHPGSREGDHDDRHDHQRHRPWAGRLPVPARRNRQGLGKG